MNIDRQYDLIEPDVVSAVLVERGWQRVFDNDLVTTYKREPNTFIGIVDGDQENTLLEVMMFEGPEAVAEIWKRSCSGFASQSQTTPPSQLEH